MTAVFDVRLVKVTSYNSDSDNKKYNNSGDSDDSCVTVMTMTCYNSDSNKKRCNNSGDMMTAIFYVTEVTTTCYNSDSNNKKCNNSGDSDDSHILCDSSDNDLLWQWRWQ